MEQQQLPPEATPPLIEPDVYQSERIESVKHEYADAEHFDKWILTLAAGTFGISITFIQYLAKNPAANSSIWLVLGWVFLILSMAGTLISMLTSQAGMRRYRDILDARMDHREGNESNCWQAVTIFLNGWACFWFVVGAFCVVSFSFLNLPAEQ